MQFQIDTVISAPSTYNINILDGIRWTSEVKPVMSFGYLGSFDITCSAILDTESNGFLDELNLYRSRYEHHRKQTSRHLSSGNCGKIHRDRNPDFYSEKAGKYSMSGWRHEMKHGYLKYHINFTVRNATREDQGMYTCALDRAYDRAYMSSWTQQGQDIEPPLVEFYPCEEHRFNLRRQVLHIMYHQETCFRCRAYGHPGKKKSILILRDDIPMYSSYNRIVDYHNSIAEGGLTEVTVTFLNPSNDDMGAYQCIAKNHHGEDTFDFRITLNYE